MIRVYMSLIICIDKSRYPTRKLFKMFKEIVGESDESAKQHNISRKQSIDNMMNGKLIM